MQNERFAHLVRLFGSHSGVAHAARADTGWVHRWPPKRGINPTHAKNLIEHAFKHGMPLKEVIWAIDPPRCSCCGRVLDAELRKLVEAFENA